NPRSTRWQPSIITPEARGQTVINSGEGFEPTTSRLLARRATTAPSPDNNIKIKMAEEEGFEPPRAVKPLSVFKTDPFSRTWVFLRDIKLSYGGPCRTRTCDPTVMSGLL